MNEKIVVNVDRELEDLMPLFMETRQRDLAGLATGLATNDFSALRVIGHGMKGSGGAFGFPLVTEMGNLIEASALAKDRVTVEKQYLKLSEYLAKVQVNYV
jgi:HPt (histidine-containing phosphotransfer) domain-containing protein